jgi:hypothetical protein
MSFFYNLNEKLAALAAKQDARQISKDVKAAAPKSKLAESFDVAEAGYSAKAGRAGKDLGKPGKNFEKIAKGAAERYGSKAAGERVAGAVLNKLRHPKEDVANEGMFGFGMPKTSVSNNRLMVQGDQKAGNKVMAALQKANPQLAAQGKHSGASGPDGPQYLGIQFATPQLAQQAAQALQGGMEEGNAFTGKLKSTPKGGKFKMGNKTMTDTSEVDEGYAEMDAWMASRKKEKGTGKFDKKERTLPSGMKATTYTRKHEDDEEDRDDSKDKQADKYASPKKKGRPKSAAPKDAERVTKGSHKYKTVNGKRVEKEKTDENLDSDGVLMTRPTNCSSESIEREGWRGGMHGEPSVVKTGKKDPNAKVEAWNGLMAIVARGEGMEPAVLKHLKQIARTLKPEELELDEEKVEAGKREFFDRLAPAAKKAAKVIKSISKSRTAVEEESTDKEDTKAERAGKKVTKDIEYDDKKDKKEKKTDKEEKVKEGTKGGYSFGGGVYESFNSKVENMITEGMNVSVNMSTGEDGQPTKSINISADGEDADKLAELLKMAGLDSQTGEHEVCSTCGESACGCDQEVVDENSPDWPTNTETLAAQPELRTYSGGLNGPKSTGQTTIPVVASQLRRQASMEENVKLERSLFKTWKDYKG